MIDDVKDYFRDTFSDDVYNHFGMARDNSTGFTDNLQYSIKSDSSIQAHYAEVARENRNLREIISLFDEQGFSSVRGKVEFSSERI